MSLIDTKKIYEEAKSAGFSLIDKKCEEIHNFVHARDVEGNTILNYAVLDDNYEFVKLLVEEHGACPLILNINSMSAILFAAESEDKRVFKFLFEEYENSWIPTDNDEIMAQCAARDCFENLKYLLEKGVNPNSKYREDSMLIWAIQSENVEIVKLLVESGADINGVNDEEETPLLKAAPVGLTKIVEYLLSHGGDVAIDKTSSRGYTPVYIASCYGCADVVKLLLERGADINICPKDGKTALERALKYGHTDVVRLLLKRHTCNSLSNKEIKKLLKFANKTDDEELKSEIIELINQQENI